MKELNEYELQLLAQYNAEKARGLLHADLWTRDMERLQIRFDTVCELKLCGVDVEQANKGGAR